MNTNVGTRYYSAPEILLNQGSYSKKVDVWSTGICLYVMLSGTLPFSGTNHEFVQRVAAGWYSFGFDPWNNVSEAAKDLIRRMINVDPQKRFNVVQVLNHEWLQDSGVIADYNQILKNHASDDINEPTDNLVENKIIRNNSLEEVQNPSKKLRAM
jgi:serine/threonine protein kinase